MALWSNENALFAGIIGGLIVAVIVWSFGRALFLISRLWVNSRERELAGDWRLYYKAIDSEDEYRISILALRCRYISGQMHASLRRDPELSGAKGFRELIGAVPQGRYWVKAGWMRVSLTRNDGELTWEMILKLPFGSPDFRDIERMRGLILSCLANDASPTSVAVLLSRERLSHEEVDKQIGSYTPLVISRGRKAMDLDNAHCPP